MERKSQLKKLNNHYTKRGITGRMVSLFTILVIVPYLLLGGLTYLSFLNYSLTNFGEMAEDSMSIAGAEITDGLKNIEKDSMSLYYSGCVDLIEGGKSYQDLPLKKDREDAIHGELSGFTDCYEVSGNGTQKRPEIYEPFWFRTFRFLKLTIETQDEPLKLLNLSYRTVGYPLVVKTKVEASDSDFAAIWEISLRTLKRCMHETYEDCPFYEQERLSCVGSPFII